jgi:cellulose synthase/poly-beta-1,6-N-acetylglucosamine synthase-like glycosyltransferase
MSEIKKSVSNVTSLTHNNIVFSIIIPFKKYNDYLFETVNLLKKQTFKNFEIILLPDNPGGDKPERAIEIPTGHLKPADKRDIGAKNAKGKFLAFIDDDAFPNERWLEKSLGYFRDPDIAMVCGPGLTPQNDSPKQVASGKIYESFIVSGRFTYRYKPGKPRFVDDFPSSNMIIRKAIFDEIGGFSTKYWPGEDTKLCLDIVYNLKKKILYSPELFCYHHRRKVFSPHLRQVYSYAVHRGFFVKRFPQNSRNFAYFVPLIFILFLIVFPFLTFMHIVFPWIYTSIIFIYLCVVSIYSIRVRNLNIFGYIFLGTILTHLVYGIGFLKGLITKELKY